MFFYVKRWYDPIAGQITFYSETSLFFSFPGGAQKCVCGGGEERGKGGDGVLNAVSG